MSGLMLIRSGQGVNELYNRLTSINAIIGGSGCMTWRPRRRIPASDAPNAIDSVGLGWLLVAEDALADEGEVTRGHFWGSPAGPWALRLRAAPSSGVVSGDI